MWQDDRGAVTTAFLDHTKSQVLVGYGAGVVSMHDTRSSSRKPTYYTVHESKVRVFREQIRGKTSQPSVRLHIPKW